MSLTLVSLLYFCNLKSKCTWLFCFFSLMLKMNAFVSWPVYRHIAQVLLWMFVQFMHSSFATLALLHSVLYICCCVTFQNLFFFICIHSSSAPALSDVLYEQFSSEWKKNLLISLWLCWLSKSIIKRYKLNFQMYISNKTIQGKPCGQLPSVLLRCYFLSPCS